MVPSTLPISDKFSYAWDDKEVINILNSLLLGVEDNQGQVNYEDFVMTKLLPFLLFLFTGTG